jgi:hypothetical protein
MYFIPGLFLVSSLFSAIKAFKRANLYEKISRSTTITPLSTLSRRDFTFLVGEYFKRRQFSVEEIVAHTEENHLVITKGEEKHVVHCAHQEEIEEGYILELIKSRDGTATAAEMVVTAGNFSKEALTAARNNKIMLLSGPDFHNNMRKYLQHEDQPDKPTQNFYLIKLTQIVLLAVILCLSALNFSEVGSDIFSTLSTQLSKVLPKEPAPTLSDDKVFSQDQVQKAMKEVLSKNQRQVFEKSTEYLNEEIRYQYEIELLNGSLIITDNAKITDTEISYESTKGVVISIDKKDVSSVTTKRVTLPTQQESDLETF